MKTIAECRKILGKKYKDYTDEQIRNIRDFLSEMVEINVKIINKFKNKTNEKGHDNV